MKQLLFSISFIFGLQSIGQEFYIDVQKVFRTTELECDSKLSLEVHKANPEKEYIIIFAKLQTIHNNRITIQRKDVFFENEVAKYGMIGLLKMESMKLNPKSFSFTVQDKESWKAFVFYLEKGTLVGNFSIGKQTVPITEIADENPYKLIDPKISILDLQIVDFIEKRADYSRNKGSSHIQKISSKNGKLLSLYIQMSADSLHLYQSTVFVKSQDFYLLSEKGLKVQSVGASLMKNMVIPDFSAKFVGAEKGLTTYIFIVFEIGKLTKEDLKEFKLCFGNSFVNLVD